MDISKPTSTYVLDEYLHRALGKGEEKIFQISSISMDSTNKILFY